VTKSESEKKAVELYHLALEREEAQRTAFLDEACADDEALRRDVLSLLSGVRPIGQSSESPLGESTPSETALDPGSWTPSQNGEESPLLGASRVGQHLAHYEVVSRVGAGGMGEVYRARDLKLGREVALKVMHRGLSSKPDWLRRFEREARAAAALNHPNIATVYEVGDHEGTRFISMELVEGQTFRERLEKDSLSVSDILRLATQIASGLAKAHAAGIVHRDLKPGNLMVTNDGFAKILDFGLVKLLPRASDSSSEITGKGSVLGTVEYMSPEQALAQPVDHRADQFSLGAILYEMATGRRPFQRDTAAQTLVAIVQTELEPVRQISADVPVELAAIVERCLAKDPADRYESTAELARELALVPTIAPAVEPRPLTRWLPAAALVTLLGVAVTALFWSATRPGAPGASETLLQVVPLTSYPGREAEPSFSPDGSQLAFSWDGEGQDNRDIYVKVIGSEQPLRLTSDPALDGSPAWSPDGSQIAFLRERPGGRSEVRLISPTGGAERRLADVAAPAEYGLGWTPDGRRLAAVDRPSPGMPLGLVLVDIATGVKETLTSLASSAGRGDAWPTLSPDGRTVAFKRSVAPTANHVHLVAVTGGASRPLAPTTAVTFPAAWTPSGEEIVFAALPFASEDGPLQPSTRSNSGAPPVLWRMSVDGGPAHQLVGSANATGVAVSSEGHRLAYTQLTSDWDVWCLDTRKPTDEAQTRFIASTRFDGNAQFSPDGQRVAFTSARSGGFEIWVADSEGANLLRLTSLGKAGSVGSPRWSPDGKSIAFDFLAEGDTGADILVVSAAGGPPRRVTTAPSPDTRPSWSGDGRWIYFASHRSGRWQVWKVSSDGEEEGRARQVTRGGGYSSIESLDGAHLYFARRRSVPENPENAIWRIPVDGGDEEVVIESVPSSDTNWDVTPQGIYFVDRHETSTAGEHWVVMLFDLDRRRAREVMRLRYPPRLNGPALSVSSDGRWILASQMQEESDLMLAENFR
jgi:serine/threonine protein kinase/Tol biopolymer transport system component